MWSNFFSMRSRKQVSDDVANPSIKSPELADTEVDKTRNQVMADDPIEIVPVTSLGEQQSSGDSDERYDTGGSGGSQDEFHAQAQALMAAMTVSSARVFSPEGTEYLTPANSPLNVLGASLMGLGDDLGDATEASELEYVASKQGELSRFKSDDLDIDEASGLKRFKPHLAKATEEDEFRKIQALEEEMMSKSQSDAEEKPDDRYSGDSLDYVTGDATSGMVDIMFRPPSVPSVEYHEDDATPVPISEKEGWSDNGRRSAQSDASRGSKDSKNSRPDNVPQLALAANVNKTDDECSNDGGEADDEDTHRSDEETPVPERAASPSIVLFPALSAELLSTGRDPCDDIMNRIDQELLVINENIERAHSPDRFKTAQRQSPHKSPSPVRRSPTKQRRTPSPHSTYLKNQNQRSKQSPPNQFDEQMSVRTEDFVEQFQNTIVPSPKSTDRILAKLQKLQNTLNDLRRPGASPTGETAKQPVAKSSAADEARSAEPRLPKPPPGREKQVESDLESVQTEDFLKEYKKTMVPAERKKAGESDADSVKTEEFERKYRDYLLNTQKNLLQNDLDREKRVAATASRPSAVQPRKYREILKAYRKRGYDSNSELDTARTDDLDYNQGTRHVAGVNVESFDEILVDSDVDTVKSADVRNKFKNAMAHSKNRIYTPSEGSEDDLAEKQYRDYIARKLTEISRLPRIDACASDGEKQSEQEDADDYDDEIDAVLDDGQLQATRHDVRVPTPQYDHLRHRRRFSPQQPGDDYQGILRQVSLQSDLTNTSSSNSTRTDSFDQSTSLESSLGSKGSSEQSIILDLDGLIQSKLIPISAQWPDSYEGSPRIRQYYSNVSNSKSTFEEVESLDFCSSRDREGSKGSPKRSRDLVQPDDIREEIPFARHVFNKKENNGPKAPTIREISKRNLVGRLADAGHFVSQESLDSTISSTGSSSLSGIGYMTDFDGSQVSTQSSRRTSLESSISSVSSPMNMLDMENMFMDEFGAEGVLGNLGFAGSSQGFLPDRFVKDWREKVRKSRDEKIRLLQQARIAELLEKQALIHQINRLQRHQQTRQPVLPPQNIRMFKRSATLQTLNMNPILFRTEDTDQLQQLMAMQNQMDEDSQKRVQFASSRQASLPVYLDTLSEEEGSVRGEQRSRSPSLEKIVQKKIDTKSDDSRTSSSFDSDVSRHDWSVIDIGGERTRRRAHGVVDIKCSPKRLPDQSSTSLEVADIMEFRPVKQRKSLIVEPAVVTTVLQDVDGRLKGRSPDDLSADTLRLPHRRPSETGSLSPSSTSPFPLSPITVIECERLDNQNDSFDEPTDSNSNPEEIEPGTLRRPSISIVVEGASDSECVVDEFKDAGTEDLYCPIRIPPDSGRNSPIPFHNQYPTNSKLVTPNSRSGYETCSDSSKDISELDSEDSSCSKKDSKNDEKETETKIQQFTVSLSEALGNLEMKAHKSYIFSLDSLVAGSGSEMDAVGDSRLNTQVQVDDGRLSPLRLFPSNDEYYEVCDRASQYYYPTRSISTQTDNVGPRFLWQHDATCQVDLGGRHSNRTLNVSTQTDHEDDNRLLQVQIETHNPIQQKQNQMCCHHCHQHENGMNQTIEALSLALVKAMDRLLNSRERGTAFLPSSTADSFSPREEMETRNKALDSSINELVDQMDCRMSNLDSLVDEIDSQVDRMDRLVDEIESVNMDDMNGLDSEQSENEDCDDANDNVDVVGTVMEINDRGDEVEMEEIEKSMIIVDDDETEPVFGRSNGPVYVNEMEINIQNDESRILQYIEATDESRKNALNRWDILSQKVRLSKDESIFLESLSLTSLGNVNFHYSNGDGQTEEKVLEKKSNEEKTVKSEELKTNSKSVSFNSDPEINHYEVPRRVSLMRQNASEEHQIERMSSCDSPPPRSFSRLGISNDVGRFSLMKDTISETEDELVILNGVEMGSNFIEKQDVQRPTRLATSLDLDYCSRTRVRAPRFQSLRSRTGQRNVLKKMRPVEDEIFSSVDDARPFHISFEMDSEGRRIPALRRDPTEESVDSTTSRESEIAFVRTTKKQSTVIRGFSTDLKDVQEHRSAEEDERRTPPPNIPTGIFPSSNDLDKPDKHKILQEIAMDYEKDSETQDTNIVKETGFYRRIKVKHRQPWSSTDISEPENALEVERRVQQNDIIQHCRKKVAMSFHQAFSTTVDDTDEGLPDTNANDGDVFNGSQKVLFRTNTRDRFLLDVSTFTDDNEFINEQLADIGENHLDGTAADAALDDEDLDVGVIGDDGFYDQDEFTSQDEEVKHNALEIHRESRRIAREMEDERRKLILHQQQQQSRLAKSVERLPLKATEPFKTKSPERRQTPIRAARSLDRLTRTPTKSDVRRADRAQIEKIEKAVFAKEIKEKLVELQVLADTVDEAKAEKRVLISELRGLRDAYNDSQNEIKLATMHSRDYKSKADELKTELTLLEYKRSQTQQELDDTEKNLATKRRRMDEIDHHIRENLDRLKDFEELGMTAEQIKGVMSEKDKLKSEVGKQEAVERERDTLKDKLLQTKEELYESEKKHRTKIDNLEEKVDGFVKQVQDLQTDKTYLQQQLRMLEANHNKGMDEKEAIIREKERDYDSLHRNLQAELNDIRQEALVDTSRLKQEIDALQVRSLSLQEDVEEKTDENTKLRDQILDLQCDLNRETELREKETQSHKDHVTKLEVEKDASNANIRQRLYAEKQAEMQEAYDLFEQERRELAAKQENKLSEQLAHHHQELIARDEENQMLREQVRIAEQNARTAEDKAHQHAKAQLEVDLESERTKWESERDRVWKLELAKISGESVKAVQQAREDAEREKDICQHLERQIEIIKQELEEQRQANRQAYKDKLDSIGRVKEAAREERDSAVERARSRAIDECNREIERMRMQLDTKDEELKRMRTEVDHNQQREMEYQSLSEKHDKTIIHEINDDCKRTAILLGVTPRKAVTGPRRTRDSSPTRSAVNAALANLRACNEQLRSYVLELKNEIDAQRSVMIAIQREKEEALCNQKEKLVTEKSAEMDILRERLIKDHMEELVRLQERSPDKAMKQALIDKDAELREIQRNMNVWKEEVAEKFAKKFEEELNREIEKRTRDIKRQLRDKERTLAQQQRDIERLERDVSRLSASSTSNNDDSETIKLLRHLQNRVKELRTENNQLKRNSTLSSTALDIGTDSVKHCCDMSNRTLENRIKQAELRADLAEDRAVRNEQLLNSKLGEIARLQGALTHQTKEVMQLERAYKNLQSSSGCKR